jgi:hypothetical protein
MSDSVPQQRQGWGGGGGRDLPRKESDDTQIVAEILKEAGAPRQTASVKEAVERTLPLSPHIVSAGVGLLCKGQGQFLGLLACGAEAGVFGRTALGIDLTYQALLFESRMVTASPNPTVNGTFQTTTHAGAITLRVNF